MSSGTVVVAPAFVEANTNRFSLVICFEEHTCLNGVFALPCLQATLASLSFSFQLTLWRLRCLILQLRRLLMDVRLRRAAVMAQPSRAPPPGPPTCCLHPRKPVLRELLCGPCWLRHLRSCSRHAAVPTTRVGGGVAAFASLRAIAALAITLPGMAVVAPLPA